MTKKVKLLYGESGGELIINREVMEDIIHEYIPLKTSDITVKIRRWKREEGKPFPFKGEDGKIVEEIIKDFISYIEICVDVDKI